MANGGESVAIGGGSTKFGRIAGVLRAYCNAGRSKHLIQPEKRRGGTTGKKVFCADHLQVSVCPKKSPPQSPTVDRLAVNVQSITATTGNRSQAICGPIVPVMVTVGTALMEIRENRLYRSEFKTFEEYCQSKWGFNRQFANKTIESSGIASGLETIVSIPNEKTAEQFVKVFCADHPQVSVCPKSPPQSPTPRWCPNYHGDNRKSLRDDLWADGAGHSEQPNRLASDWIIKNEIIKKQSALGASSSLGSVAISFNG